jgi:anti-anti-sigma regulatory factor
MSIGLDNSLFWAMRYHVGNVVIDLAEAESIDIPSVRLLAKAQRLLNSEGRKLTFRSPSRLDALVRNLYR